MASGMHSTASVRPDHGNKSRQLNFEKAMSDFKNMFPSIDVDVIEMVLRANNGLVDATVDQLLTMQDETTNDNTLLDPNLNVRLPSYNDSGSAHLSNEPPPAYTPRVENDPNFVYDSTLLGGAMGNFSTPKPPQDAGARPKTSDWNPPLVGTLPNDFLRLSVNDHTQPSHSTSWPNEPDEPHRVWVDSPITSRNPTTNRQTWTHPHPVSRTEERHGVDRRKVNGFDGTPDSERKSNSSSEHCKSKSKNKIGQMSRKFKRKKTKNGPKTDNYKPIAFANLVDEDSSDENAQR